MKFRAPLAFVLPLAFAAAFADPSYHIYDLGVVQAGDTASQGFRISGNGTAAGRSFRAGGAQAFSWTLGGGIVGLGNPTTPVRPYAVGNGVNNNGVVAGTGATTSFGSNRLPVIWNGTTPTMLSLPAGETIGDANDINDNNVVVGSVDGGSNQQAVVYQGGVGTVVTATTSNGSFFTTAFAVNNAGIMVGHGIDPNNAAITAGLMYNINTGVASSFGALTTLGHNSAIGFDISETGHIVGASSLNGGVDSRPFVWTSGGSMVEVPLPTGTSQGSARGVNSAGWVVGTASSAFAIPFVYDGANTYRVADIIENPTGWDLSTNTSSSAMGISEAGSIVGTGVFNGAVHGYVMTPVPEATPFAAIGLGLLIVLRRRRS